MPLGMVGFTAPSLTGDERHVTLRQMALSQATDVWDQVDTAAIVRTLGSRHLKNVQNNAELMSAPLGSADLPNRASEICLSTLYTGDRWLASATSLGLVVPSAVVPIEWNLLVNPQHANVNHLRIVSMDSFAFDA